MSNYVKTTDFASKDTLASGNPLKTIKGTEFDVEFNNLVTASATKANTDAPTFTGIPAAPTAVASTNTTQLATTAFVVAEVATVDLSSLVVKASNLSDLTNASTARTNLGLAIGTDVQAYDADTAKLDAAANFTQALQNGGSNVVVDTDIGTTVLAPNGDGSALTGVDSLPTQTSQSGKFLTTNGTAASWGEAGASGSFLRITRYSTAGSGTWSKPSDTVSVLIRTIAGGGSGRGADNTTGGSGGSSGGYSEKYIATADSSYSYVVGAGGAAGSGQSSAGNAGGETTIAGISGGGGGGGGFRDGGTPTVPTGGDLNIAGGGGMQGTRGQNSGYGGGGSGGSGVWGGGGSSDISAGTFGGGGAGSAAGTSGGGSFAGGSGYIEIWEYS